MAWKIQARSCFTLLLILVTSAPLVAQSVLPEQFITQSWSRREGLPLATIHAVTQDRAGFLWIATDDGFARFDGHEFTIFDRRQDPQIPSGLVQTLLADPAGGLWIGTHQGLLYRHQDETSIVEALRGLAIQTLHRTGEALWIGTQEGLFRWVDGNIEEFFTHLDIRALESEADGLLRIGAIEGLFSFDPETRTLSGEDLDITVLSLLRDSRERLWIGTLRELHLWDPARSVIEPVALKSLNFTSLLEDRHGRIWAGSDEGLNYLDSTVWHHLDRAYLPDYNIKSLFEDHEGSLWVGTLLGGLAQVRRSAVTTLGQQEGLFESNVWSVLEDRQDRIWIATSSGLATLEPDGHLRQQIVDPQSPETTTSALGERQNGEIWIGTYGYGLFRFRDGAFERIPEGDDLIARRVLEDSTGVVRVAANQGLFLFEEMENGKLIRTKDPVLADRRVQDMVESSPGSWWFGLTDGLLRRQGEHSERVSDFEGHEVRSLLLDADGTLWLATDLGLARLRNAETSPEIAWIGLKQGIPHDMLHVVLDDGAGRLWMSSNRGIFSASRDALNAVAAGHAEQADWVMYDRGDGLRSNEANGGTQTAGWVTRDGRVLIPTIAGLAIFDPGHRLRNPAPPPIALREVLVDGKAVAPVSPLRIAPGTQEVVIQYSGTGFQAPERIRYRYRLNPRTMWNVAATRRVAVFTDLSPGRYSFEVTARHDEGVWNPESARLELIVEPAWHQKTTFFLFCGLVIATIIFGVHRLRLRRLLRRQGELLAIQRELARRNAELEELAYAASHDLRNPLVTIHTFLGALEFDLAAGEYTRVERDTVRIRDAVGKLDQLLRDLFEPSRLGLPLTDPQTLDPVELAEKALQIVNQNLEQRGIEVFIQPKMPAVRGDRRRLLLVFESLLENAGKHMGFVESPRVEVTAQLDRDRVIVRVADNGRGIAPRYHEKIFDLFEQLEPQGSVSGQGTGVHPLSDVGTGVGLSLARRIVEVHGGEIRVESAGDGTGAVFSFTLPAAHEKGGT